MELKTIGKIYSPFEEKKGMPIQSRMADGIKGKIEIFEEFEEGLSDLDGFSHIYLIYLFHKSEGYNLKTKPFLSENEYGVFATRAPRRPNPIGISIVKLLNMNKNIIEVENLDILNGTPLLDIKPYIPQFDLFQTDKNGWTDNKLKISQKIISDNRFG